MGLTIHYELTVPKKWSIQTVREKLEALRQACMDVPVTEVSELREFKGEECQWGENKDEPLGWAKTQAVRRVQSPWELGGFYFQPPHHMIVFAVIVAPGCEPMNVGICAYPPFVFPKRHARADGQLRKPVWSLAVTDAGFHLLSARILKKFAKAWRLHRLPWSDDYHRSQESLLSEKYYRACVVRGRHISHRRGDAPSWVLVELADQNKDYIRWRFTGSVEEARELFTSAEFKDDMERLLWGEE